MTTETELRLLDRLVAGGVLASVEVGSLPAEYLAQVTKDPYALTASPTRGLPAPALRWRWETARAADFCRWAQAVLRERMGVALEITPEPADAPELLRLRLRDREETVDWSYLNSARWMGAFCTIAARLLGPRGVEALTLETGDLDTVLLFCRTAVAPALREMLPGAE